MRPPTLGVNVESTRIVCMILVSLVHGECHLLHRNHSIYGLSLRI